MAKTLSKAGITTTSTIEAGHVSQSVDAFTGIDAYDITISGSLTINGPASGSFTGSFSGSIDGTITSASFATSASYATTASYALTANTASYSLNNFQEVLDNGSTATISEVFDLTVNENITIKSVADTATLTGDEAKLSGSNNTTIVGNSVNITGKTNLVGAFTASGDISSSGILHSTQYKVDGVTFIDTGGGSIFLGSASTPTSTRGNYTFINPITASSDISSSGIISASAFSGDGSGLTNIPAGTVFPFTGSAIITGSLIVTGSGATLVNGVSIVEVESESDFPTPVGTQITLAENTTYLIKGVVDVGNTLFVSGSGIGLHGVDNTRDTLRYTSSSTFLTVVDSDFSIQNLKFSATNTSSLLISGSDYTSGSFNQGRDKFFEVINCQFRNCGNVIDFKGYDLVDFNNVIFTYIQAPTIGVRFQDTSKVEISSCEFIRWYDETSNPSPSGYSTAPMIQFRDTGSEGAGFGAVNINGCIIHPQVQQDGVRIDTGSTTGFGTISSNAFVTTNLTTGSIFYPTNVQGLPDYSLTSTKKYDVFANQGILNSTSGVVMTVTGNTAETSIAATNTPVIINASGSATNRASVRFEVSGSGRATYTGTKQVYVSTHASIDYEKVSGGGSDVLTFYVYKNGGLLSGSGNQVASTTTKGALSLNYGTLMNENDYIELYVENTSNTNNVIVSNYQLVIRE